LEGSSVNEGEEQMNKKLSEEAAMNIRGAIKTRPFGIGRQIAKSMRGLAIGAVFVALVVAASVGLVGLSPTSAEARTPDGAEAAATEITIEPEECQERCFFFRGVRLFCYEICF
jgi:hypothetical protein